MDDLPTLHCKIGIENTDDGILVDGVAPAPGTYRLILDGGTETLLTVAGPVEGNDRED